MAQRPESQGQAGLRTLRQLASQLRNQLAHRLDHNRRPPRGFISNLEDWLQSAQAASVSLHEAYPEEVLRRQPPDSVYSEVHSKFTVEFEKTAPASFVIDYPDGRCWGASGTVLSADNLVIAPLSYEFRAKVEEYRIFEQAILEPPVHLPGTAVLLAAPAGQVFGHFLFDVLPKLGLLEESGFDWKAADHFIISGPYKTFQRETLTLLGIEEDRIADCTVHRHYTADRLLVPSRAGVSGNYPKWAVNYVRNLLLPFEGSVPTGLSSRLLVSRAGARGRKIANESELFAALEPLGFTLVRNEELSMPETIAAYRAAEFVVGPMGSSMCSTLFCEPGTRVIEAYPDSSVNVFTWAFGQFLGQKFGYLIGDSIPCQERDPHDFDYRIDIFQMNHLLNKLSTPSR